MVNAIEMVGSDIFSPNRLRLFAEKSHLRHTIARHYIGGTEALGPDSLRESGQCQAAPKRTHRISRTALPVQTASRHIVLGSLRRLATDDLPLSPKDENLRTVLAVAFASRGNFHRERDEAEHARGSPDTTLNAFVLPNIVSYFCYFDPSCPMVHRRYSVVKRKAVSGSSRNTQAVHTGISCTP